MGKRGFNPPLSFVEKAQTKPRALDGGQGIENVLPGLVVAMAVEIWKRKEVDERALGRGVTGGGLIKRIFPVDFSSPITHLPGGIPSF